jgi:hypothetical protein
MEEEPTEVLPAPVIFDDRLLLPMAVLSLEVVLFFNAFVELTFIAHTTGFNFKD